jgi:ABC-type glycerol-3-phosphate transport system substrate-binding protein
MKKVILLVALITGTIAAANAATALETNTKVTIETATTDNDGYKEVKLDELSQVVQASIKALAGETYVISKVEYSAELELVRATLTSKEDQQVKVVLIDKNGKEVKPTE